jgi:acyl carrier protein
MQFTRDDVFRKIRQVTSEVIKVPQEEIVPDGKVTALRNVNSIALLEIVAKVEIYFGIDLDEESLFQIDTLNDFVDSCMGLLSKNNDASKTA